MSVWRLSGDSEAERHRRHGEEIEGSDYFAVILEKGEPRIYGVVSYSVAQRVHEMAIRLALGASSGDLLKLVIGKTMLIVLVGLALGGVGALALTRVLASLLYDTSPTDCVTWAVAGTLLATVALLACYFPARRATRLDPVVALRAE